MSQSLPTSVLASDGAGDKQRPGVPEIGIKYSKSSADDFKRLNIFSRVQRDSTPRFVSPSFGRSVGLIVPF